MNTEWQSALARVATHLTAEESSKLDLSLRALHRAICLAPPEVAKALGVPCDAATVDTLLDIDAPRELAFRLLPENGYILVVSRGRGGEVLATLEVDQLFDETHGRGPDEASAIVAALAGGLARVSLGDAEIAATAQTAAGATRH